MGFFGERQSSDMQPLVELPKAGEPIVFDEEEQRAVDWEIKKQEKLYRGRLFPKDVAETMESGFAAEALRDLAKSKLRSGDLKGAASTCVKSLGLSAEYEGGWLLLAEILAEHGDIVRSKRFLDEAKKVHKQNKAIWEKPSAKLRTPTGDSWDFESVWKNMVQKVENIIKSKESK